MEKDEFSENNSDNRAEKIHVMFNYYYYSAYNCLCSLIILNYYI